MGELRDEIASNLKKVGERYQQDVIQQPSPTQKATDVWNKYSGSHTPSAPAQQQRELGSSFTGTSSAQAQQSPMMKDYKAPEVKAASYVTASGGLNTAKKEEESQQQQQQQQGKDWDAINKAEVDRLMKIPEIQWTDKDRAFVERLRTSGSATERAMAQQLANNRTVVPQQPEPQAIPPAGAPAPQTAQERMRQYWEQRKQAKLGMREGLTNAYVDFTTSYVGPNGERIDPKFIGKHYNSSFVKTPDGKKYVYNPFSQKFVYSDKAADFDPMAGFTYERAAYTPQEYNPNKYAGAVGATNFTELANMHDRHERSMYDNAEQERRAAWEAEQDRLEDIAKAEYLGKDFQRRAEWEQSPEGAAYRQYQDYLNLVEAAKQGHWWDDPLQHAGNHRANVMSAVSRRFTN